MIDEHKELQSIQFLRAIACIMVVLFHISTIEQKYSSYSFASIFDPYGRYGVDLFFVISGFILTYLSLDKFGQVGASGKFLARRLIRVYPVYWQFSLIVLAVFLLKPEWVNSGYAQPAGIIESFLLIPQKVNPLLSVGWTLIFEMYFYLVFAFALLFSNPKLILVGWASVTALLYAFAPKGINPAIDIISSPLVFEFMVGCPVAWAVKSGYQAKASALFATAIVWYIASINLMQGQEFYLHRTVCYGIPAALIVWACLQLNNFNNLMCKIGDASYSIYLSHILVLSVLGRMWASIGSEGIISHTLWIICLLTAPVAFGILNYCFVEKPLLSWTKALNTKSLLPQSI